MSDSRKPSLIASSLHSLPIQSAARTIAISGLAPGLVVVETAVESALPAALASGLLQAVPKTRQAARPATGSRTVPLMSGPPIRAYQDDAGGAPGKDGLAAQPRPSFSTNAPYLGSDRSASAQGATLRNSNPGSRT